VETAANAGFASWGSLLNYSILCKETRMLQAALYARVSTDTQEKEQTIDSQLAAITQQAEERGFHTTPALTYIDDGWSGTELERPALDELRDHAREGRFDVVVVLCPDRLARKYAYQVLLLEELNRAGVEVHFCERPIGDSPDDQLLLQIQGAIAEYERAKILERSRRGRLHRARMGELGPGELPYGYRRDAKRHGGDGRIQVHEEEAAMVRQVFAWYDEEDASVYGVARKLEESKWPARRGKWSVSTVVRMLRCEWYIGTAYYNRTKIRRHPAADLHVPGKRAPRRTRVVRPRSEWIEVAVPPLIDEELFGRVQQRLEERRRFARRNLKTEGVFLLRGLLKCGLCGHAYIGSTDRKHYKGKESVYHYYRCGHRQSPPLSDGSCRCRNESLGVEGANEAVWSTVRDLLLDSDALSQELSAWIQRSTAAGPDADAGLQRAEARLQELIRQRDRLTDAYQTGALPLDLFRTRIESIEESRRSAEKALAEIKAEKSEAEVARIRAAGAKQIAETLKPRLLKADFHTRETILRLLVERVVVHGQRFEIHLALPVSSHSCLTSANHPGRDTGERGRAGGDGPVHDGGPDGAVGAGVASGGPAGRVGGGGGATWEALPAPVPGGGRELPAPGSAGPGGGGVVAASAGGGGGGAVPGGNYRDEGRRPGGPGGGGEHPGSGGG
jgi:site-specific DNA recombinase